MLQILNSTVSEMKDSICSHFFKNKNYIKCVGLRTTLEGHYLERLSYHTQLLAIHE